MSDPFTDAAAVADRLIDAALALAAEDGWLPLSLADIAGHAGVPLAEAFAVCPNRAAVFELFLARIDAEMLAASAPDLDEPARDRLFEVIMARFDALAPYRGGMAAIVRSLPADPLGTLRLAPGFARRLALMLEAAGLAAVGPLGVLRVQGLALIYADTLRVWLGDESPDLARTMAALDRGLRRVDGLARGLDRLVGQLPPLPGFGSVSGGHGVAGESLRPDLPAGPADGASAADVPAG